MEKTVYFQLLQNRQIKRLTLDLARDITGQHIRWFRYGRHAMSAREFTIGNLTDLLTEGRSIPSNKDYGNLTEEWLATLSIEELQKKSSTLRIMDPDGIATPLITENDERTGDIYFVDEDTGQPVHFILDTEYRGSIHRTEPADITDIIMFMSRQQTLENYITFYSEGCLGARGLQWIPPKKDSARIKEMLDLYNGLSFEGKVPEHAIPEEITQEVKRTEYDSIFQLTDKENQSLYLAWIR